MESPIGVSPLKNALCLEPKTAIYVQCLNVS